MLSALLRAGRYLTAGLSYLSTTDSILMSSRYQPLRFCLSAIPTCRSLPLIDMLFSIPTLPHFLPTCALHEGEQPKECQNVSYSSVGFAIGSCKGVARGEALSRVEQSR